MGERDTHTVELEFNQSSSLRLIGVGLLWGVLALVLLLALYRVAVDFQITMPSTIRMVVIPLLFLCAVSFPPLILRLRHRSGRVTWDEWGVTEWEGDAVRTAIPWSSMHYLETRYPLGRIVRQLLLTDGDQRKIVIEDTSSFAGRLTRRRICAHSQKSFVALLHAVRERCRGRAASGKSWNELSPARPGSRLSLHHGFNIFCATFACVVGAVFIETDPASSWTIPVFTVAVLTLFLRAIRPLRELVTSRKEGRRFKSAVEVTLVENAGHLLTVRSEGQEAQQYQLDTELMAHPDGRLAERRGAAWVALERAPDSGSPYRGTSPSFAPALEMDDARRVRKGFMRAVTLEVCIRLGFVALAAAVLIGGVLERGLEDEARRVTRTVSGCLAGESRHCDRAGRAFERGLRVPQDRRRAAELYERACDDGVWEACTSLALLIESETALEGVHQRPLQLFERACRNGSLRACTSIAQSLLEEPAAQRDRDRGCSLLERACLEHHEPACSLLRQRFLNEPCELHNRALVVTLLQRSCIWNHGDACYQLGLLYQTGRLVEPDPAMANAYFRAACSRGIDEACSHLDSEVAAELRESGPVPVPPSPGP